jgi:hypothetical protein
VNAKQSPRAGPGAAAGGAAWQATPTIGQPHDSIQLPTTQTLPQHLQDLADLAELAEQRKQAGDRAGFWEARRRLLLAQSRLWQALHPREV